MTPNAIQFHNINSTWVMRITADRRIEVNDDVEVTDAAKKVLEAMQSLLDAQRQARSADTWVGPDALTTHDHETPEYKAGWNDCRQMVIEMLKESNT